MNAKLFFDTETGGLDPKLHPVLQIAWIIDRGGDIQCERSLMVKPDVNANLTLAALAVNGFTLDGIMKGVSSEAALEYLRQDIRSCGAKNVVPVGHNARFDVDMLYAMANKCSARFWCHFGPDSLVLLRKPVCTANMSWYLDMVGKLALPDYKLCTLCAHYNIHNEQAHDALGDVRATRSLFYLLDSLISGGVK